MSDPIVISGMSGRFPESDSTDELADNMYANRNLFTDDDRRWPKGLFNMTNSMGKIKNIDRIDGKFFMIGDFYLDESDPGLRILLETTYEAIVDAGINPQELRGSKTGVYISCQNFGMPEGIPEELFFDISGSDEAIGRHAGFSKGFFPNTISYFFDFRGPSLALDTNCSGALVAFHTAISQLNNGDCDYAIVGGAFTVLMNYSNKFSQMSGIVNMSNHPNVWGEEADGYTRGETVSCVLLQRQSQAKRVYATVLGSSINNDGYKSIGRIVPQEETQEMLMTEVIKKAGVSPSQISYFEAHATGTEIGDVHEAIAIYNALRKERNDQRLIVGLGKSIIGHGECVSGMQSLVKVLLSYERESICANLNVNNIKSTIKRFCPPLDPIRENIHYDPDIAGINNFGIGGVNVCVILEPNRKTKSTEIYKIADNMARIVNLCARTEESFNELCDWFEHNPQRVTNDFLALLAPTMRIGYSVNSCGMPYRGSLFIKNTKENSIEFKRQYSIFENIRQRPVWFVYPGLGGQWVGMAKALMPIKVFADKLEECHQILQPFGVNLKHLLLSDDKNSMSSMTTKYCATTSLQICLTDLMKTLGIIADHFIGHSFGEIAVAYADGCLTTEQALMAAFYRGITDTDPDMPNGYMAVVGMSCDEANNLIAGTEGVYVCCNNGKNSVVMSGHYNIAKDIANNLKDKGIFVRELENHGMPAHCELLIPLSKKMIKFIEKYIPEPKPRSSKWVSTCVLDTNPSEYLRYASAQYFAHNLITPVFFYNRLPEIPDDAIVIELSPHRIFGHIIESEHKSVDYMNLLRKDSNDTNLETFLNVISKFYELGLGLRPIHRMLISSNN